MNTNKKNKTNDAVVSDESKSDEHTLKVYKPDVYAWTKYNFFNVHTQEYNIDVIVHWGQQYTETMRSHLNQNNYVHNLREAIDKSEIGKVCVFVSLKRQIVLYKNVSQTRVQFNIGVPIDKNKITHTLDIARLFSSLLLYFIVDFI